MVRRARPIIGTAVALALLAALLATAIELPGSTSRRITPQGPVSQSDDALAPQPGAARVYPLAARFAPGEEATIRVEALSPTGAPLVGPL